MRILHIEDNPADVALFSALLKQVVEIKFQIDHADKLSSGVSKASSDTKYDAIVLDLGLPDSFGLETYTKVRESAPDTPILIVTGNDDRELLANAMNNGADNYLIKEAFDGNRVAVAVLAAIRQKQAVSIPSNSESSRNKP